MERSSSYVEWSTVFAGAVLASALSLVMLQFGTAVGVADIETFRTSLTNADLNSQQIIYRMVMTGVFLLIIQVLASMLGGYVAGRMRAPLSASTEHEKEVRDGVHGALVWATATLAVAVSASLVGAFAHVVADGNAVEAAAKAEAVLNREHNVAILLAFAAAATSLVSGVAAWAAAVKGGDHRDLGIDFGRHITFLVRK